MKNASSEALRNLHFAGTLLGLVAFAALGLAYWSNVTCHHASAGRLEPGAFTRGPSGCAPFSLRAPVVLRLRLAVLHLR